MQLELKEGAAVQDAQDLKAVVSRLRVAVDELSSIMKQIVNSDLSLEWADVIKENWDRFAETNMEDVFRSITSGAESLENAVKEIMGYNTESN